MLNKTITWGPSQEMLNLPNLCDSPLITLHDINLFSKILTENVAGRLNVSFNDLLPIVKKQNQEFYKLTDKIFSTNPNGIKSDSDEFKLLCDSFKLPIKKGRMKTMPTSNEKVKKNKVDEAFELFNSLDSSEKIEFILKIQKDILISLTPMEIIQYFSK